MDATEQIVNATHVDLVDGQMVDPDGPCGTERAALIAFEDGHLVYVAARADGPRIFIAQSLTRPEAEEAFPDDEESYSFGNLVLMADDWKPLRVTQPAG